MPKRKDLARLWLEMENELFPALSFDAVERVLYYFFFACTHLVGRRTVHLSLPQIAKGTQLSWHTIFHRIKLLREKGCLRSHRRNYSGTIWELALPRQILGPKRQRAQKRPWEADFLDGTADRRARKAILRRERGHCFYCLRLITRTTAVLDHVVPRSKGGGSSYKNLVACCVECNTRKRAYRAPDFLRTLFRKRQLSTAELNQRLTALTRLARGHLRISLAA